MPLPSTPVQVQQRLLSDERLALDQPDEGCLKNGSTMNPANLTRWTASKLLSLVLDVVTILFSCIFLVYGLSIKTYDGLPLDTSEAKLLKRASNLAPTIYPILFAAIVGKALKSIAFWKLERGSRVGVLDQLLGSTTIFQTIITQVQMRTPGLVSVTLILTWALSPLGGQASIRVLGQSLKNTTHTATIHYVNTSSSIMGDEYSGSSVHHAVVPVDALFGAALVSFATTQTLGQDSWGNIKIPMIEYLGTTLASGEGWYQIPSNLSTDHYASLLGLPLSEISSDSNTATNFDIETSYWVLKCPVLESIDITNRSLPDSVYSTDSDKPQNLFLASQQGAINGLGDYEAARHVTYTDLLPGHSFANCTIETSFVEVSVHCSTGVCAAKKIRRSLNPFKKAIWTALDYTGGESFGFYTLLFVSAIKEGHASVPSPYQNFILNPYDPFNKSWDRPAVSTVSNTTFSIRLGQLLNTYWMALLAPTAIPKGLHNANLTADTAPIQGTNQQSTEAAVTRSTQVLKCDNLWLMFLLLSTAVTTLIGIFGLVATICRRGPELGLNISSMIKDSPFVDQPAIPSTLDASDRMRMCKNLLVKYGDVACEDEAGYVAIGNRGVSTFNSRRLFL
ncbi:hypothetical protein D6D13_01552 [Aureobasidium pullulans]|uniref:Uncharacterized protein n=1 Tax=Aureobasidium pullulans TaxID=5580 RepID=A0A4S9DAR1_AURPU|nr:hypothetical protein D6D13_01552 [Aureobasidium pullulans]